MASKVEKPRRDDACPGPSSRHQQRAYSADLRHYRSATVSLAGTVDA